MKTYQRALQFVPIIFALGAGLQGAANNNAASAGKGGPNRIPPPAPANLTAVAGDQKVSLSWDAARRAASYSVYRGLTAGGESATPVAANLASTTFTDANRTNGVTYYYKVAAINSYGTSPLSNEANATPAGPTPPPAPSSLSALPGDRQVALAWSASAGAASYNLYRGTSSGGQSPTPVRTGITTLTVTDTGLTNGTAYFYKVAAVNSAGPGNKSNEANATPAGPTPPPAPSSFSALPGDQQVVLAWSASVGAASYNLYRGTLSGGQSATPVRTGITALTVTDTGLTNGTRYYYTVAAVNANGTGNKSNEANAMPTASGAILSAAQKRRSGSSCNCAQP